MHERPIILYDDAFEILGCFWFLRSFTTPTIPKEKIVQIITIVTFITATTNSDFRLKVIQCESMSGCLCDQGYKQRLKPFSAFYLILAAVSPTMC